MAAYENSANDGIRKTQMAKMTPNEFLIAKMIFSKRNSFNILQSKIFVDLERKHGFSRENATYDLYDMTHHMSHNNSQKSVILPGVIEMLIILHHCYVIDRNHSITDIYRCFSR